MRNVWILVTVLGLLQSGASPKDTKWTISADPLTPDHIAIYRTVLKDYTKDSEGALNLSNRTDTLDHSMFFDDDSCFRKFKVSVPKSQDRVVHRIDRAVIPDTRIILVDPDRQALIISENDPQRLMKSAIDDHQQVSDEQLEQSVKRAFKTGLFTLSEIAFDKEHRTAVVAYSFDCGALCGRGNTLVLKKAKGEWKIAKRCVGWVS